MPEKKTVTEKETKKVTAGKTTSKKVTKKDELTKTPTAETLVEAKEPEVKEPAAAEPKAKTTKSRTTKAKTTKAKETAVTESEEKTAKAKETAATEPKAKTTKAKTTKAKSVKVKETEIKEPEVKEPKAEAPKVEEPEVKKPEVKEEKAKEPDVKEPEVKEEKAKEPEIIEPKAEEPAMEEPKVEELEMKEPEAEEPVMEEPRVEAAPAPQLPTPRRSVAFIGSECYPFVKTGGLGDVMYALPKALIAQNCDVKVILPRYKCIPWEYQQKMVYRGAFEMNLCADGRSFYVGIMEYVWDGVVYDFIDNEDFFSYGNPYTNLIDDIPRFCFFGKAALAALNYMDWIPDVIHCHDWQAGLVPVYLRTLFENTPIGRSKVMITIHNLRFQGVYNVPTIRYWSGLPDYVFNKDALLQDYVDANMLKGGLTYANMITTVSGTYAGEIQMPYFGEKLDAHLRYHSGKLRGIVNGIDYGMWDPSKDNNLRAPYDITNVLDKKKENKLALQEELGLIRDENKFIIALISRLTDQKGLNLVNAILPQLIDGHTQVVVLGTGDRQYEDSFRYYEGAYKGNVCSNIMYDEGRAHKIYAGADALMVPSLFEPCGLTQLIAMHYGTVPIVRETGGLRDTVQPYNQFYNEGNGFTFDRYEAGLLLDAINRAKTLYFTNRWCWDEMVQRDMAKDVSWENSAKQYRGLYMELTW